MTGVHCQKTQGEDPNDESSRAEYLPWIEQVLAYPMPQTASINRSHRWPSLPCDG